MGKDIKLNSSEWIDFVFEKKNRSYGAYFLRRTSGRGHFIAVFIVLLMMALLVLTNMFISARQQKKQSEQLGSISTTVELTNIDDLDLPEEKAAVAEELPPPPKVRETMSFTPPIIEDDDKVSSTNQMKAQTTLQQSTAMVSLFDMEGSKDPDAMDVADLKQIKVDLEKEKLQADNRLYDKVDEMPQFPGGAGALAQFIAANVKYPKESAERGVEGRVMLRFVVEKDGSIGDIRVTQSVDAACDAEAIRVIRMMPRWIPGKHQGRAARVWFTQPIAFELR